MNVKPDDAADSNANAEDVFRRHPREDIEHDCGQCWNEPNDDKCKRKPVSLTPLLAREIKGTGLRRRLHSAS
jgi:hypothetical protein